jgi:hypothetical protein
VPQHGRSAAAGGRIAGPAANLFRHLTNLLPDRCS